MILFDSCYIGFSHQSGFVFAMQAVFRTVTAAAFIYFMYIYSSNIVGHFLLPQPEILHV